MLPNPVDKKPVSGGPEQLSASLCIPFSANLLQSNDLSPQEGGGLPLRRISHHIAQVDDPDLRNSGGFLENTRRQHGRPPLRSQEEMGKQAIHWRPHGVVLTSPLEHYLDPKYQSHPN